MRFGYYNGEIKPVSEISIPPYDLGFLRGYSVCSVLRTTKNGKIFLLTEQYQRIYTTSEKVGLDFGLTESEFEKIIYEIIKKSEMQSAIIRIIVTGGLSDDATTYQGQSRTLIVPEEYIRISSDKYENGVNIASLNFKREYPEIKTTNYLKAVENQNIKKEKNAFEILFTEDRNVFECSTSNIFVIKNDKIITPKEGCLPGTTRALVLRLIRENNFLIEERAITMDELMQSDEVFLTAANKDILPVTSVDGEKISDGNVGPKTKELIQIRNKFEDTY